MNLVYIIAFFVVGFLLTACEFETHKNEKNEELLEKSQKEPSAHFNDNKPLYLVKTTVWTGENGTSLHFITDSLDENTKFDPENAALVDRDFSYVAIPEVYNPEHAFYVGEFYGSTKISRYVVNDAGEATLDGQLDFSGISGATGRNLLRATQFMSETKAYVLDHAGLQVIVFNPTDMTFTDMDESTAEVDTISLAHLADETLPSTWSVFPTTDGDRFVGTIGFYGQSFSDQGVTKLVIVDSADDSLATDTVTNCTAVSGSAKDAAGNMYFASYDTAAVYSHFGAWAYEPCMVRVNAGANEFDDSYYMQLKNLTNTARPAMGAVTGDGNFGYGLILSDHGVSVLEEAAAGDGIDRGTYSQPFWEFYYFDLTDENAVATKVNGVQSTPGIDPEVEGATFNRIISGSINHHELGKITWMAQADQFETQGIYNATNSESWTLIINSIPGQIETVGRLR